jgi:hypothetical protein
MQRGSHRPTAYPRNEEYLDVSGVAAIVRDINMRKRLSTLLTITAAIGVTWWVLSSSYFWPHFRSSALGISFRYPPFWKVIEELPTREGPPNLVGTVLISSRARPRLAIYKYAATGDAAPPQSSPFITTSTLRIIGGDVPLAYYVDGSHAFAYAELPAAHGNITIVISLVGENSQAHLPWPVSATLATLEVR